MHSLKKKLIRLGNQKPSLRKHLRPVLDKIAGSLSLEAFKQKTEGEPHWEVRRLAKEVFPLLGIGSEAAVYEVSSDKVLKVSDDPKNLRAEFFTFSNPKYDQVTPDAYDHHDKWGWIVVERVKPFKSGDWDSLLQHFPSFVEFKEKKGEDPSVDMVWTFNDLSVGGKQAEWVYGLQEKEKNFFLKIKSLHEDLNLDVADIRPANFGIDNKGNVVLLDILTSYV